MKSPKWVVNKRATINQKNGDNKCFQYLITVALHDQDIENHPERRTNIGPHIGLYNWEKIGKDLNGIIRQLLLISCLYHIIKEQ